MLFGPYEGGARFSSSIIVSPDGVTVLWFEREALFLDKKLMPFGAKPDLRGARKATSALGAWAAPRPNCSPGMGTISVVASWLAVELGVCRAARHRHAFKCRASVGGQSHGGPPD